MPSSDRIVVVYMEGDAKLAQVTASYLESHGLRVTVAPSAQEGMAQIKREQPDVILLDPMLPDNHDFEVCRSVRERVSTPIIIVTARTEEADQVMGLEGSGADDYVPKPFSPRELLARVRAKARRSRSRFGLPAVVTAGILSVDTAARSATVRGKTVVLTASEFDLLRAFVERPGRALTRNQLLDLVRRNSDFAFARTIDAHICRLREKVCDDPRHPRLLMTVRGVGYMLAADPA